MTVGTFTTDHALVVRTWDGSLARASGISTEHAVGRRLAEVIPSLATRRLLDLFQRVIDEGTVWVLSPSLHRYLVPCPPTVPSPRFSEMQQRATLGPLREGDRVVGVVVAIEDVTARIDAERDLAESGALAADWRTRRAAVQQLAEAQTPEFVLSLLDLLKTKHRDFNLLSSTLQLLAGADVGVAAGLVTLLQEDDADLRIQAALALGGQRTMAAEAALRVALGDVDANVRFQAIESLGRLRAETAVDELLAIARSGDAFLAFAAIDALSTIGEPRAAPALVPLLEIEPLSAPVADALGALGDDTAVEPLVRTLDRTPDAAGAIVQALTRIHDRLEYIYEQGALIRDLVARALSEEGYRVLADAVSGERHSDLSQIVRVLGWLGRPDVAARLAPLLDEPVTRPLVVQTLVRSGEVAVDLIAPYLHSADEDTQHAAVGVLGLVGSRRATPALLPLIGAPAPLTAGIAGALGRIGDPAAFEPLLELLHHPAVAVRQAAIGAINAIGHPDTAVRIATLLDSPDPLARESAVRIAGYFGYPQTIERVFALAADDEEAVRCAAFEQLPVLDESRAFSVLSDALGTATPALRTAATRALARLDTPPARAALTAALGDVHLWVRYFAARALAEQRDVAALDALIAVATRDAVPPVRIAAVEAIATIDPHAGSATLLALARDASDDLAAAATRALGAPITGASALLTELVRAASVARRAAAIDALAMHDELSAVSALACAAGADPDSGLRLTAIEALGRLAAMSTEAGDAAADVLVRLLIDRESSAAARRALARLPAARRATLSRHLDHSDAATRRALRELLERLHA